MLIVEDDAAASELMGRALRSIDCRVTQAENGRVGLEHLNDALPDAILLDLMMPACFGNSRTAISVIRGQRFQ
ncbi:response regulator (plasmid) [Bradyrhizobium sp. PMVTL-01]|uniref:response regulator n=1 Tax=Bradyrhizobium sp. PMVTL-01 TaxID=3434999 RepID=UPI003F6E83C0